MNKNTSPISPADKANRAAREHREVNRMAEESAQHYIAIAEEYGVDSPSARSQWALAVSDMGAAAAARLDWLKAEQQRVMEAEEWA